MPIRNVGRVLRETHAAALSPMEKIELNVAEAKALIELDPDGAWRGFVARWRRSHARSRPEGDR